MNNQELEGTYKQSLKKKLKHLEEKCAVAHAELLKNPTMENISRVNNLRTDIAIVKSRIDNIGKHNAGFLITDLGIENWKIGRLENWKIEN